VPAEGSDVRRAVARRDLAPHRARRRCERPVDHDGTDVELHHTTLRLITAVAYLVTIVVNDVMYDAQPSGSDESPIRLIVLLPAEMTDPLPQFTNELAPVITVLRSSDTVPNP